MESTPAQMNNKILHDWFFAHADSTAKKTPKRSNETMQFLDYLWPSADQYYSPLNPIFLAEYSQATSLSHHQVWLARDGLIPLLWFFKTNPTPKNFQGKIWIEESLAAWVPQAWRKCTGSYTVESTPEVRADKQTRKLLISGLVSVNHCTLSHLEKSLADIPSRCKNTEILAFLPPKHDHFGEGYYGEFNKLILQELGMKVHFINWQSFNEMKSFKGYELLELNEKLLCADSFICHHALSRGASLMTRKNSESKGTFLQISPFHGMRLKARISDELLFDTSAGELKLGKAMFSEANHRFPWPKWFEVLSRELSHSESKIDRN